MTLSMIHAPAWGSLAPAAGAAVHYVLELAGMALGGWLYWRDARSSALPADRLVRLGVVAGAALGAALGARALYLWQYAPALAGQPLTVWLGGKTVVGGLLGGLVGVETSKALLGWRDSTGDRFVVPLLVAMIMGRVGCQLSGLQDLTYGTTTTLPWGWDYGDGLPRHPTSLYEIAGLLLLGLMLLPARTARWRSGDRFALVLAGYLLLRFALEFLKPPFGPAAPGVLAPARWAGLSAIQWACLAGLAYYALVFLRRIRRVPPLA